MKSSNILLAVIAICLLTLTANQANAQSSTVQATGTVLTPMTFTSTANLAFGTSIFPGVNKSIARTDASAANFAIDGEPGKQVTATFTLPTTLTHTDAVTTMPVSFSTTDAGHAAASTGQGTATAFDPNATLTTTLDATSGELHIWLGGTVQPLNTQKAGAYSGDVILDMAYTGV